MDGIGATPSVLDVSRDLGTNLGDASGLDAVYVAH